MTTAQKTKNKIDRVRRRIAAAAAFCKENGIAFQRASWFTKNSVCGMGAIVAHQKNAKKLTGDLQALDRQRALDRNRFVESLAKDLGIRIVDVGYFIAGFDDHIPNESDMQNAFYRLGRRTAEKYVT